MLIGRDNQHAEIRPAELFSVLLYGMCGGIDAHLALDAGLLRIGTPHRHRAAVDLRQEIAPAAVRQFQPDTMSGMFAASRTTPRSDSFASRENGFATGSRRGAAAIILSAVINL